MSTETLSKLYLELANVLPDTTVSSREVKLHSVVDSYGIALMTIAKGGADPQLIASKALDKNREFISQRNAQADAIDRLSDEDEDQQ